MKLAPDKLRYAAGLILAAEAQGVMFALELPDGENGNLLIGGVAIRMFEAEIDRCKDEIADLLYHSEIEATEAIGRMLR